VGLTLTIFALTGCGPVKFYSNPGSNEIIGTGWLPPRPDLRDYTEDQKEIKALSKKLGIGTGKMKAATSVDLRQWCSPVENQGKLGSCTAHAGNR